MPIESAPKPIGELNPVFEVLGKHYVMTPQAIASIPVSELKRPVASLADQHDRITRTLDFLLIGF